ncbi:MAG: hypothetical protein A2086_09895 [Spirochaetes bacterium GWD1_27_9]|nr:MAG: hypothetical protein A2Z98_10425 [Spirochaetes bacterium GWB1_27_13]OHD26505.1 MAG: hypothetical protein A2Y34_12900 [Spirochaetes bacterium GWC1_27_15]OHD42046.1 MAG: hypothetical protein A2086_09895 [Spirochaetes bacterium GWD1_27_9]
MIKKGNNYKKIVDSKTRVHLIRKGNEFFSEGKIQSAENIFITVDYKDGLVRLGDYYLENNNIYKATQMYFLSENQSIITNFCQNAAKVITKWLDEDKNYDKILTIK